MVARKRKPLAAKDANQQAAELDIARDPKTSEASAKAQQIMDDLDARGDSLAPACSPEPNPGSMVVSANPCFRGYLPAIATHAGLVKIGFRRPVKAHVPICCSFGMLLQHTAKSAPGACCCGSYVMIPG